MRFFKGQKPRLARTLRNQKSLFSALVGLALLSVLACNVLTPPDSQAASTTRLAAKPGRPICPAIKPASATEISAKAASATISPSSLPNGVLGVPYSASFSVNADVWDSGIDGTLPPGLSYNSQTMTISGKPTTVGSFSFTLWVQIVVEFNCEEPLLDDLSQSYTITIVKPEDAKIPADLVAQLRVAPDRIASTNPSTPIVYTLTVKNLGYGKAEKVRINFPVDTNLTLAEAKFSDDQSWVSQNANGMVKLELPPMENNQSFTITLTFHPAQGAKSGATVEERFTAGWDDAAGAGKHTASNASVVTLSSERPTWNDTGGAVQWFDQHGSSVKAGSNFKVSADFYAPNEWVNFWYTDKDGHSFALGGAAADSEGKISFEFSTRDWKPGQTYVVAGLGTRSQLTGSAAITVNAV